MNYSYEDIVAGAAATIGEVLDTMGVEDIPLTKEDVAMAQASVYGAFVTFSLKMGWDAKQFIVDIGVPPEAIAQYEENGGTWTDDDEDNDHA